MQKSNNTMKSLFTRDELFYKQNTFLYEKYMFTIYSFFILSIMLFGIKYNDGFDFINFPRVYIKNTKYSWRICHLIVSYRWSHCAGRSLKKSDQ